jgi:stress response protein YsnF
LKSPGSASTAKSTRCRIEGDTTIIPVVEEILVVEKRLVLVEEIRIRQVATTDEVSIPVTLRKQTATVERIDE